MVKNIIEQPLSLTWEITTKKEREQTKKAIRKIWLSLFVLVVIGSIVGFPLANLSEFARAREGIKPILLRAVGILIGFLIGFLAVLLMNKFVSYRERSYFIDDSGITISEGKRKKYYLWNEFECFYPYSEKYTKISYPAWYKKTPYYWGEKTRQDIFTSEVEISGEVFYLKKKLSNIFSNFVKKFVVVYSEPDNSELVSSFLSRYLTKGEMKSTSDLGLVFYEFRSRMSKTSAAISFGVAVIILIIIFLIYRHFGLL